MRAIALADILRCVVITATFFPLFFAQRSLWSAAILARPAPQHEQQYLGRKTAHKTHTTDVFAVFFVLCVHCVVSNLLITWGAESFNSVPGHHVFSELGEIVKPLSVAKKALYRGWKNTLGEERLKLHRVDPHPFTAMRLAEERSLSSIVRSKLLPILINNDVSGKVNASGVAKVLDKFHGMQTSF
jgi:hypothetical protein